MPTASRVAVSAADHVPAQVAFALIFAAALVRWGLVAGGITGVLAYVIASAALSQLPQYAAITLGVTALAAGALLLPHQPAHKPRPRKPPVTIAICLSAAVAVLTATLASRVAGPALGGAVAGFPATTTTLAIFIAVQGERSHAANVAFGLISSLPCFMAFALVVVAAAPRLGLVSVPLAAIAALAVAAFTWRQMNARLTRRRQRLMSWGADR